MAELKAGGLAIVISSPVVENIGRVVELVEYWGILNSKYTGEVGPAWKVKVDKAMILPNGRPSNLTGLIFSRKLMPIDGDDFSHEKESEKQLQNA